MKVLKWILGIIVVIAAVVLIWGAVLPKIFYGESVITIDRPAMMIYQSVASFENRAQWDPWIESEPEAEVVINSAWENNLIGSEYSWNGEIIGTGMMRIDSVIPGEKIYAALFFGESEKPGLVTWIFTPEDNSTKVTWTLTSETAYPIERIIFSLMGKGMKESFDRGLSNLKSVMEEQPVKKSYFKDLKIEEMNGFDAIVAYGEATMEQMPVVMGQLYGELFGQMNRQGLQYAGMPFSFYHDPSANTEPFHFYAGIPVDKAPRVTRKTEPMFFESQKALSVLHIGSYEELNHTYTFLMKIIQENQIDVSGQVLEFYQNDPEEVLPEELVTKIVFLLNQ